MPPSDIMEAAIAATVGLLYHIGKIFTTDFSRKIFLFWKNLMRRAQTIAASQDEPFRAANRSQKQPREARIRNEAARQSRTHKKREHRQTACARKSSILRPKISALFGKDATYPKTGRIRECADQKNTPRACSLTSSETENGMRVVYPRRAATIILVGHA